MSLIKKMLFVFLGLIIFSVVLLIAADNSSKVALKFLDYQTSLRPVSWWMVFAFIVGFAFSSLINLFSNLRLRSEVMLARKKAGAGRREPEAADTPPALEVTTKP